METKTFPCSSEGMVAAQGFLECQCDEPKPAIILDEIVSNIVRCSGASSFSIGVERSDAGMTMVFSDDGQAFDPTCEVATPDVSAGLEDRGVGGLGIFMVKKMSKSLSYRREDDKNILTILM